MQVIKNFFDKHLITKQPLAVGVSGGADSLALVLMLKQTLPDWKIIALTVDHQLRPSSRREAEYVRGIMEKFGIEHHILTWEGVKPENGIEEQARTARYHLLCDWCQTHQVKYLAIAHHLYDQAETFLMRLQRGSGLRGLAAMNEKSYKDGVCILRPLLSCSPDALKRFLEEKQLDWVEDESNQCMDFLRVKMRKFLSVLEKNTGISAERLALAAENLQRTKDFLDTLVAQHISAHFHLWYGVAYSCDYALFLSWHPELQYHILAHLITTLGGNGYTPEASSLLKIIASIDDNTFDNTTLGGCYLQKSDLRLWIITENRQNNNTYTQQQWENFIMQNPSVRGINIPHKLKSAILNKKIS